MILHICEHCKTQARFSVKTQSRLIKEGDSPFDKAEVVLSPSLEIGPEWRHVCGSGNCLLKELRHNSSSLQFSLVMSKELAE